MKYLSKGPLNFVSVVWSDRGGPGPLAPPSESAPGAVYGDNAIEESMVRKLFSCFKEDCFDMMMLHVQKYVRGLMKLV